MSKDISRDFLFGIDAIANEKDVDREIIFQAVECALASVTAKRYDEEVDIRVSIDRDTGQYDTFRQWTVVPDDAPEDEDMPPSKIIHLTKAQEVDPGLEVGDVVEEMVDSVEFGRIGAQQVKQVIVQKVREAERSKVVENYAQKLHELITGTVKKVTRDFIILDLGNKAEGVIPKEEMIPREVVRMGDRLRGYLYEVNAEGRGPQILLTRTRPDMLIGLFKIEVPEISEDVIQIRAAARDPGSRAKIAVKTNDGRIDPVGACVGMRGSRVQTVSSELNGERIDIILWDDNPAQLVINAMAPAEVTSILVDEDTHSMDIAVPEEQLSQAIGRNGQNVRLASELTGWTLNVMSEKEADEKTVQESDKIKQVFVEALDVDEEFAAMLIQVGFSTIEEVAYLPQEELQSSTGLEADVAEELQSRARDFLLTRELASEEDLGDVKPDQDLLDLEGMSKELAYHLASSGIVSREDLAECSVDDVIDVNGMDEALAAKLIMNARKHWFEDDENQASSSA